MDIDAIISLDAVDSLNLRTSSICQLIVGSTIQDGSFDVRTLKGAARNGDDGTTAVLCLTAGVGFSQSNFQLHDKLQLRSVSTHLILCAGIQYECQQHSDQCYSLFHLFIDDFLTVLDDNALIAVVHLTSEEVVAALL